jgi:hypothetical protein
MRGTQFLRSILILSLAIVLGLGQCNYAWAQQPGRPPAKQGAAPKRSTDDTFGNRTQFNVGTTLQLLPNTLFDDNVPLSMWGIQFGGYYAFSQQNDIISFGLNPNIHFGFGYNNVFGASVLLQTPTYVMFRAGANATRYTEFPVGIGAGLGLNYSYVQIPFGYEIGGRGYRGEMRTHLYSPVACLELNLNLSRFSTFALRFHRNFLDNSGEFRDVLGDLYRYRVGNFGFVLSSYF